MAIYASLFLLSAGTLVYELTLTRIFSLAQFHHFAFVVVSLALLGFGASGSLLASSPTLSNRVLSSREKTRSALAWIAMGCAGSTIGSYLVLNTLPFDSYAIAWDGRQLLYLAVFFLAPAVPFAFTGLAVGLLLAARPADANRTYAVNLLGSGVGCLLLLPALPILGGERTVILSAGLTLAAALVLTLSRSSPARALMSVAALAIVAVWLIQPPQALLLRLSPYKGLYQALLVPEAEHASSQWNAFSRVDVVESPSIRSLPGLSLAYRGMFPEQVGVAVNGDHLMPITARPDGNETAWAEALPEALAYQLRPGAEALILTPGGGLAAATALANGAARVTVVENNSLLVQAVRDDYGSFAGGLYSDPRVILQPAGPRAFARQARLTETRYSVIHLALIQAHRSVSSGAYSLGENYIYTVEAFADYMELLDDGGLMVVTRWLQTPPSESVRVFSIALEALERAGIDRPSMHLVAYRSFQTGTLLISRSPWSEDRLAAVRSFCERLRYDLTYYPGMRPEEANRYTVLSTPIYYDTYAKLTAVFGDARAAVYDQSTFEITPPTDNQPFFFHFFKWRQAPQVLQTLGMSWQPFGGAGYFVLLILLGMALAAAILLILLPAALAGRANRTAGPSPPPHPTFFGRHRLAALVYFCLLGFGFLLVEIPLIQQFILFVDQPAYSMLIVLFVILLCSGFGSMTAKRWRLEWALGLLVVATVIYLPLLRVMFRWALGWPLAARLALTFPALAPLSLLMGVPFARGLLLLESRSRWPGPGGASSTLIPWAWAINGCASVVASILAALLALSIGFQGVLWLGAGAYAGAWLVVRLGVLTPDTISPA